MKRIGWLTVIASLVFLGVIAPVFLANNSLGVTRVAPLGWVLLTTFLVAFVSGIWMALSRER